MFYISIHTLNSVLGWSTFTDLLGYDGTRHLISIWQVSAFFSSSLHLSSSVRWMRQTHIFISCFSRNIWLNSSSDCGWATQRHSLSVCKPLLLCGSLQVWAELLSSKHHAWNWGPSDQIILFLRVWDPFGAFMPSVFPCVFTEGRIEFGHTSIKPRQVECCSDVCPSVSFSPSAHTLMELN